MYTLNVVNCSFEHLSSDIRWQFSAKLAVYEDQHRNRSYGVTLLCNYPFKYMNKWYTINICTILCAMLLNNNKHREGKSVVWQGCSPRCIPTHAYDSYRCAHVGDLCVSVCWEVTWRPWVYPDLHLTRRIHHLNPACRNVYDALLNIIMALFVSIN